MSLFGFLGSLAAPLIGGLFSNKGAQKSASGQQAANETNLQIARETNQANTANARELNAFNAAQAQKQMDFQAVQSSTQHQREVADLKAAGLNPMLSGMGGSGAAAMGGASASGALPNVVTPHVENTMSEFANSGRDIGSKIAGLSQLMFDWPLRKAQVSNAELENNRILENIKSLQISNAQQGMLTPLYARGGSIIKDIDTKYGPKVSDLAKQGIDLVLDTLNSPEGPNPAQPGTDVPSSAGNLRSSILSKVGNKVADDVVGDSGARDWYQGKKGFWESVFDSSDPVTAQVKKAQKSPQRTLTNEGIENWLKQHQRR